MSVVLAYITLLKDLIFYIAISCIWRHKIPILVLALKCSCNKFMSTVLLSQALSKMYRNLLCARIKLWCNLSVVNE